MSGIVRYKPPRREDWELNQVAISEFVNAFCKSAGRMPTKAEIAAGTGLSWKTVARHIKRTTKRRATEKAKIFYPAVVEALAVKAMMGDTRAAKLFFEHVMDWDSDLEQGDQQSTRDLARQIAREQEAMEAATDGILDESDESANKKVD